MSFLDHIEKIQKKPEHIRKKVATVITVLSTGLIVLVWLTVANPLSMGSTKNEANKLENDPFSMIKDIKDTASAAGTAISDFKDGLSEAKDYAEILKRDSEQQVVEDIMTKEEMEAYLMDVSTTTAEELKKEMEKNLD